MIIAFYFFDVFNHKIIRQRTNELSLRLLYDPEIRYVSDSSIDSASLYSIKSMKIWALLCINQQIPFLGLKYILIEFDYACEY